MRFLGPVFWYDLVRVARRQPLATARAAYGLFLLIALFLLYATALPEALFGGHVTKADAANFARRFADVFMAVQFAAVILITPALTANAVAEERGQNTLTFLLSTHLSNREILLGKLFTRLLQVGLLILTGLPVLALVQFMGGVYLPEIVAQYVALALTALSLGCLGMFCGVFVKKPQNAAWRAYQILVAYLALSLLSIWYWNLPGGIGNMVAARAWAKAMPGAAIISVPSLRGGRVPPPAVGPQPELTVFEHTLEWFNVPNPY
ncbi:MAG TPA: ABC transporter permease, partial [Gemmataceae bacterium]|nr:ABC transporter permease [Gemmataceae bacterium]